MGQSNILFIWPIKFPQLATFGKTRSSETAPTHLIGVLLPQYPRHPLLAHLVPDLHTGRASASRAYALAHHPFSNEDTAARFVPERQPEPARLGDVGRRTPAWPCPRAAASSGSAAPRQCPPWDSRSPAAANAYTNKLHGMPIKAGILPVRIFAAQDGAVIRLLPPRPTRMYVATCMDVDGRSVQRFGIRAAFHTANTEGLYCMSDAVRHI